MDKIEPQHTLLREITLALSVTSTEDEVFRAQHGIAAVSICIEPQLFFQPRPCIFVVRI